MEVKEALKIITDTQAQWEVPILESEETDLGDGSHIIVSSGVFYSRAEAEEYLYAVNTCIHYCIIQQNEKP